MSSVTVRDLRIIIVIIPVPGVEDRYTTITVDGWEVTQDLTQTCASPQAPTLTPWQH
jgi:hypothetical protein